MTSLGGAMSLYLGVSIISFFEVFEFLSRWLAASYEGAAHVGDPLDATEASEVAWHPISAVIAMLAAGDITDGLSLTGLSVAIATGSVATS